MGTLKSFFSLGLSFHFEDDRLLDNAIRDGIAENRVWEDLSPVFDRELGGHDCGKTFHPSIHKVVYIL